MKQRTILFFFVLLLSSLLASSHLLVPLKDPNQGGKDVKVDYNTLVRSSLELNDDMEELMGSEECHEDDEGCFNRRLIVEAHLDYIYTEHHKP